MKITHNKVGQNLNLRDTKLDKTDRAGAAGALKESKLESTLENLGSSEASRVDISSRAQDIRRAKELAKATPDVDEAKVSRLQKLIDDGKYKTDAAMIADRLVDEQLKWE